MTTATTIFIITSPLVQREEARRISTEREIRQAAPAPRRRGVVSRIASALAGPSMTADDATAWICQHVSQTLESYRESYVREVEGLVRSAEAHCYAGEIDGLREELRQAGTLAGFQSLVTNSTSGSHDLARLQLRYSRLVTPLLAEFRRRAG